MELTVAQKLDMLLKLQQTDSKLDEIRRITGDLPEEVRDLEDEIAGYETRVSKLKEDINRLEEQIKSDKQAVKDAEKLIAKYEEQKLNVRNNREFDAINKEVELQTLDIQLRNKKGKEAKVVVEAKKAQIDETKAKVAERKQDLENKKKELDTIVAENAVEETALLKHREELVTGIEERLYLSYSKLRGNAANGLAVVTVKRGACGGCFNMVPPQRQADIREKKKVIVCEHCGRVLADVEDVPVLEPIKKVMPSRKKAEEV